MRRRTRMGAEALWALILIYVFAALFTYSLRHPEFTQMQVLLSAHEALLWR